MLKLLAMMLALARTGRALVARASRPRVTARLAKKSTSAEPLTTNFEAAAASVVAKPQRLPLPAKTRKTVAFNQQYLCAGCGCARVADRRHGLLRWRGWRGLEAGRQHARRIVRGGGARETGCELQGGAGRPARFRRYDQAGVGARAHLGPLVDAQPRSEQPDEDARAPHSRDLPERVGQDPPVRVPQ